VFVYGTLRSGYSNSHLLEGIAPKARGFTAKCFVMYVDEAQIPYIREEEGSGAPVCGELFEVDAARLAVLDELEEHPEVYLRVVTPVRLSDGREVSAWVYVHPDPPGKVVPSSDYADCFPAGS